MTSESPAQRGSTPGLRFLPILIPIVVLILWVLPLRNSFWLDEALTAILSRGATPFAAWHSALLWSQSPLFSAIEWCMRSVFGSGETSLRLPSLLAGLATLFVLYRIGRENIDRESGVIFAAIYVILPPVAAQVTDARPYALGLLARTLAILFLFRWLRTQRRLNVLGWALGTAAAFYLHYFFGIAIPIDLAFVLFCRLRGRPLRLLDFAMGLLLCSALMLPCLPHVTMLAHEGKLLAMNGLPYISELFFTLVPFALLPAFLYLAIEWRDYRSTTKRLNIDLVSYSLLLGVAPPLLFFVLSRTLHMDFFLDRYVLSAAPGIVILWGSLLRAIEPYAIRRALVIALILLGPIRAMRGLRVPDNHHENWRSATSTLTGNGPIIYYSGLVESRRLAWLNDPQRHDYLLAAVLVYQPESSGRPLLQLPFDWNATTVEFTKDRLGSVLGRAPVVDFVLRNFASAREWQNWITQEIISRGYVQASRGDFGDVKTFRFHRQPPLPTR